MYFFGGGGGGASQKIVSLGVMIFIAPSEFHRCLKRLLPNLVSETGLGGGGKCMTIEHQ
jgi:hypothetical protein